MFHPNAKKYEQIVEAAIAEFQENGYVAASMDRISQRSGTSKRTVYKYFESKEKLYSLLVERLSNGISEALQFTYDRHKPIREQLYALAWAKGRLLMRPEIVAVTRIVISEALRNPEEAQQLHGEIDSQRSFVDFFSAATEDGQLSIDNCERAVDEFLALLKARAFWPVMLGAPMLTEPEMEEIITASVEFFLRGYAR